MRRVPLRKVDSRSLAPHGYRTTAPRDPRGTTTSALGRRGATRYMLRVTVKLWGSRRRPVKSTMKQSQSLRLLRLRRLCLTRRRRRSSRTPAPSLLQPPDPPQKTGTTHQPQRQHLHTRIRVQREHLPNQQRPRGRERRSDQSTRGIEVAGHGRRGAAPARRLHR